MMPSMCFKSKFSQEKYEELLNFQHMNMTGIGEN